MILAKPLLDRSISSDRDGAMQNCDAAARSGKIANYPPAIWTMMDNDSFVGDCHWDGL